MVKREKYINSCFSMPFIQIQMSPFSLFLINSSTLSFHFIVGFFLYLHTIYTYCVLWNLIGILSAYNFYVSSYTRSLYFYQQITSVYFEEGWLDTKVYMLASLDAGHCIAGPAIIMDKLSTILIEPGLFVYIHILYRFACQMKCLFLTVLLCVNTFTYA